MPRFASLALKCVTSLCDFNGVRMHPPAVSREIDQVIANQIARRGRVKVEYAEDTGPQVLLCRRAGFAEGSTDVVFGPFVPILPAPTVPNLPPQPGSPTVDYTDDDVQMAQAVSPQRGTIG